MLPLISIVTGYPVATLDTNGNLRIIGVGYDPALGGTLVTAGKLPELVRAHQACNALSALLDDFDFQTPGDRSRALASFLSPALTIGGFINGRAPADVAEADQSQAGKGYRQKVVAAIYGETPAVVAQKKGGVGGIEESFSQALIAGRLFIQLDNLRGAFDSQFFEAFFTADLIGARVPHKAEVPVDPRRFFIFASSNGVDTTRDLPTARHLFASAKRSGISFGPIARANSCITSGHSALFILGVSSASLRSGLPSAGRDPTKPGTIFGNGRRYSTGSCKTFFRRRHCSTATSLRRSASATPP